MKILILTSSNGETKGLYKVTPVLTAKIKNFADGIDVKTANEQDKNIGKKLAWAEVLITSSLGVLNPANSGFLKWVHLTSAGVNNLPKFIKDSRILVTNSSGVHPIPISEHVFGLMLMLVRNIHKAYKVQIKQKEWLRIYEFYKPGELFGKKLLIVGVGRIGERIAKIAEAFGMDTFGVVRDPKKKRGINIKLFAINNLKKALREADFVVNALPGTDSTKDVFNLNVFKKFKKTAYFINIGRGTTVVEADLIKALKLGLIKGAGLDVFESEPLPDSSPLWELDNIIITPHYSGWTPKYFDRVVDIFIENLKAYLQKKPMPNLVDKELGY